MSLPPHDHPATPGSDARTVLESLGLHEGIEGSVLSFLQHRIRDVIFVLEVTQRDAGQYSFIYVNAAFEAATGVPPDAVVGCTP